MGDFDRTAGLLVSKTMSFKNSIWAEGRLFTIQGDLKNTGRKLQCLHLDWSLIPKPGKSYLGDNRGQLNIDWRAVIVRK